MPESADNVTYNFGASGSVLRTVAARLQEIASAKDFGAKGDGVTDDTAALKAAAAYLAGLAQGGILYLPSGDYLVTDTVRFQDSGISLLGAWPATRIINGAANKPTIQFGDGTSINYRCSIEGLVFGQKAGVTAVGGNCGLRLVKQYNAMVRDVECYPHPAKLHRGIVIEEFVAGELLNVNAQDMLDVGISITDGLDVYGFHLRSDNNGTAGFEIVDSEGMYIVNGAAYGNAGNGWRIRNGVKADSYHHFYVNCIGDTSGTTNWQIEGLKRSSFTACWGATQKSPGVAPYSSGFLLVGGGCESILFNGCWAISNNAHGIQLYRDAATGKAPRDIVIDGCMLGTRSGTNAGNGRSGTGYGLFVDAGCVGINVTGGYSRGNTSGPLFNAAGAECQVTGLAGYP